MTIDDFIHELRTTDKKQIVGRQYDGEGFCAFGLLRNLIKPNWRKVTVKGETLYYWQATPDDFAESERMLRWIAEHNCGLFTLNDLRGYSFAEIANRLERRQRD